MSNPQPAKSAPQRVVLDGRYVRLEPIGPEHVPALYAASVAEGVEARFAWLPSQPPRSEAELAARVAEAVMRADPLTFAVVDRATGLAGGQQSFMRIDPPNGAIEIGGIMWGPDVARTRLATEALYLFARHAFDELGYRRFEWKCNALNGPSRRAAERFGFTFEGTFRQHMIVKGANRDTCWFSILDGEWPRLKAGYESWLDPANFDEAGRQKSKLAFG